MVQAVGVIAATSTLNSTLSSPVNAAGLQYQLVRFQKELAECVNCASAKTAQGKATIEAISGKISSIRLRIDEVARSNPVQPVASAVAVSAAATATGLTGTINVFA
jgi:hypothetical protein